MKYCANSVCVPVHHGGDPVVTPEPATTFLFALGLVLIAVFTMRKKRKK